MLQRLSPTVRYVLAGLFVVGLFGLLLLWLKPDSTADDAATAYAPSTIQPNTTLLSAQQVDHPSPQPFKTSTSNVNANSTSQSGIDVNCQLQVTPQGNLIVNRQTKDCYEFFITQYGEKPLTQIKTDFKSYIDQQYQSPTHDQILDLWQRYLDYRQALGGLTQPINVAKDSVDYFRATDQLIQNLRQRYFSPVELTGLFGDENIYTDYTLERLAILDDKKLSESEKAVKLQALLNTLPEDLQNNIKQIQTLDTLHKLTASIKARGGTIQDIRQMRVNLVGAEAASRLEALDSERLNWKTQVTQYLNSRDQLLQSSMSDHAKQQAIAALRQRTFSQSSDALRVQSFETIHDQGGQLPFND